MSVMVRGDGVRGDGVSVMVRGDGVCDGEVMV